MAKLKETELTFVPLYLQLAKHLEQRMDAGEFPPGSRLPTEERLANEYAVSMVTARGAMRVLFDRGRVERFPGRGTFVLDRGPIQAVWGLGSIADIDMTTIESRLCTLSSKMVDAPDWVWRSFGLGGPAQVNWMQNVRSVRDERFMVSNIYHHPELTSVVRSAKFRKMVRERKLVVLTLCALADIKLEEIRQSLSATVGQEDAARALGIEPGTPLLVVDRVFRAADGRVIQVGRTHYRVDRYQYSLNLRLFEDSLPSGREPRRRLLTPP